MDVVFIILPRGIFEIVLIEGAVVGTVVDVDVDVTRGRDDAIFLQVHHIAFRQGAVYVDAGKAGYLVEGIGENGIE